jgi:two-component system phosphate regulon sensor histidine kinase PhoR
MKSFFPWRLFWKFFLNLLLLINLIFILSASLGFYVMGIQLEPGQILFVILIFFILSVLGAAGFSYRFSSPLKRVILKALRLANKKQVENGDQVDEVFQDEPGEYFELEVALDKIRRKMKKRRLQLASERAESQALMLSLDDAILSVTKDLKIKFFNARFANLFLSRQQSQLLSRGEQMPLAQVLREPEILALFESSLVQGVPQSVTMRLNSQIDGMLRDYQIKFSPLREPKSSNIYAVMALFHDVTELKKSERIRIEFVENASHELRTPLTSMKGFVETLKEDVQAGRMNELPRFLNIISRSVDRLSELVNDMLSLSALESDVKLKKELVHPMIMTEEIVGRLKTLAEQKQIQVKIDVHCPAFMGDSLKIEQVLQNLLDNAIKYGQEKGHIQILWKDQGNFAKLHVIDDGPGLSEDHIGRVFERFYRIDKGRSRDVGGTGLGLSIVKHIMQGHGGSVQVLSKPGQGSEFICSFPKS